VFASLRTLLTDLIDYAGLFPPARLSLDQAIRNYARYRQGNDAWMLGRFVIPASRLEDLEPYDEELFSVNPPFSFSVLGRGGNNLSEFLTNLRDDLRDVAAFRKRHGERVWVDMLEVRLPPDLADPRLPKSTSHLYKTLQVFFMVRLFPFCEAPGRPQDLLDQLKQLSSQYGEYAGFKLRCGGLEASAFPSTRQVAAALYSCREGHIAFKATAGLHHPLPCFDAAVGARMHGFINVFLAGVLAYHHLLPIEQMFRLLDDDQPDHFSFTNTEASWQKYRITTAKIAEARGSFRSFGSCSFEEPCAGLRTLGWL